ncbi:MAG: aminotransferase class III-fold pyridoxal phosphate-dependent enzyme [Actinomycetes bacterium]
MASPRQVGPSNYFNPASIDALPEGTANLVRRRLATLGPAYRLFYDEPVEFVRGSGVHLYDVAGNEYLDVYNNVASCGHAHPRVAAAIAQQAATLSTHTRYLNEAIVRYSEDLLATMPDAIGHVMYTCTGSEACDLALRIAKHRTGGTGVIVTRNAYHGVTTEIAAISPSLGGVESLPPWVRWVPAPDSAHTDISGFSSLGEWFADQVQQQIDDLAAHGIRFAAFIADSIFASDGVFSDPVGFLAPVRAVIEAAGGVYIADEVQPGFGRTGSAMWGFDRHSSAEQHFVPDLVTIGKPMGNGMPIAATLIRPEVIEEFARDMRYFNTYGGNAMAIAAAQAVLDVIRDEGLQANAADVGDYLRRALRELATRYPHIADVRGDGLFIAVELVIPESGEPNEALMLSVVNGLRRRRVLIGTAGLFNNNLKVRPPLVFSRADADRFVAELDGALAESTVTS